MSGGTGGMKPPQGGGNMPGKGAGNTGNTGVPKSTRPTPNTGETPSSGDVNDAKSKLASGARTTPKPNGTGATGADTHRTHNAKPQASRSGSQGKTGGTPKGSDPQSKSGAKHGANTGRNASKSQGDTTPRNSSGDTSNRQQSQSETNGSAQDKPDASKKSTGAKNEQATPDKGGKPGALDQAKNAGANATGVDYSDKGLKDQLEHQAADLAMDATPVLGQVNSARKALKDANKQKNAMKEAAGKETGDDALDKLEEGSDKVVDGGIKAAKFGLGGAAAGQAAYTALMMAMMMKMLMMLKGVVAAVASKVVGFIGGIVKAVGSVVSAVTGVAASIGNAIAAGFMAIVVGGASILGVGAVQTATQKDDSSMMCVPSRTAVTERSQEFVADGEYDVLREENAMKLWSVYSTLGSSKEQTAAVLGNLQAESGLDSTSMETIYNEPFAIGPRKADAISKGYKIRLVDSAYSARFPAIEFMGIGLAQWTNGRNQLLVKYADDKGVNWFEFDTQIQFMFDGDDKSRQRQLMNFLVSDPGNVEQETERFMNTWIGLSSPNPSLGTRKNFAMNHMFTLERATVDTDYAESILSGLNFTSGEGNAAAGAYHQDDGCGNPIKSHYGNGAADGTGAVDPKHSGKPYTRETLPDELKEFAKNPEDAGVMWGNASGWASNIYPDQCAAFSASYFMKLYPDWNKNGRPSSRPFGDGGVMAGRWAAHYGQSISNAPAGGAMFSDTTTSTYGHTGIVQHVFANGDILIAEQNVRGASGAGAGISYSWSWRVITKSTYEQKNWTFFKPADAEPQWGGSGN